MKGLSSLYRGLSGVEPTADDIGAVKKAGDTMTGALILSGSPTEPNQAATKSYVDSNSSSWGSIGGTLSNQTDLQNALNAKQDTLVSGTNIKTINSTSILGSGNLSITASAAGTNTQVQFNDSGSIGGDAGLTYNKTTNNLNVDGRVDASAFQVNGTAGNGYIDLKHQSADASPPSAFSALFADSNGNIKYKNDGGYYTTYSTHTNTANRIYTFQDKSYTLAEAGANTDITSISLNQSGLVVKGATSNALTIKPNETLSASRTLNLKINDVDRTIDLSGNLTVSGTATISGTNTGDQTNITGNAGTATTLQTPRSIYGNNFDGSAALSQIIASTFGGTGNGFTKFTGAAGAEKTYTLPDASATILTDNTAVTVPQGGTGLTTLTTAYGVVCAGTTANGSLQNAGAGTSGQYLKSNGASLLPSFASFTPPTIQKFTSGSGTYTTPAGVLYIRVKQAGGGAGGAGSGAGAGAGADGGNTTFGTSLLVANGGTGGVTNGSLGGAGGSSSLGTGPIGTALSGGYGQAGFTSSAIGSSPCGGFGGTTAFGGAGSGGNGNGGGAGGSAIANTGAGGGGAGGSATTTFAGAGGGAGGFIDAIILSPSATYSYAVGSGGAGGTAGTSGFAGGAGGSGYIEITEFYN
jgi:hypothetical protein